MNANTMRFRATTSHWIVLALAVSPLLYIGMGCLFEGARAEGVLILVLSLLLIGYNATALLIISSDSISLWRYGFTQWSVPIHGTRLSQGRGGDIAVLRGYLLTPAAGEPRFLLRGLFPEAAIDVVRRMLG